MFVMIRTGNASKRMEKTPLSS